MAELLVTSRITCPCFVIPMAVLSAMPGFNEGITFLINKRGPLWMAKLIFELWLNERTLEING